MDRLNQSINRSSERSVGRSVETPIICQCPIQTHNQRGTHTHTERTYAGAHTHVQRHAPSRALSGGADSYSITWPRLGTPMLTPVPTNNTSKVPSPCPCPCGSSAPTPAAAAAAAAGVVADDDDDGGGGGSICSLKEVEEGRPRAAVHVSSYACVGRWVGWGGRAWLRGCGGCGQAKSTCFPGSFSAQHTPSLK